MQPDPSTAPRVTGCAGSPGRAEPGHRARGSGCAPAGLPAPRRVGTAAGYVLPGLPRTHRARHTPRPSGCASSRRLLACDGSPGPPGTHRHAGQGHPASGTASPRCWRGVLGTLHKYPGHGALLAVPWAQRRQPHGAGDGWDDSGMAPGSVPERWKSLGCVAPALTETVLVRCGCVVEEL